MQTFDDFKKIVSIAQIAHDLGYKLDKRGGSVSPTYKLFDSSGTKIDEIIIKDPLNLATHHYFDRNGNGGDVVSFIKNHINDFPQFSHSNQFVKINMILSHYANIPFSPTYQNEIKQLAKPVDFNLLNYHIQNATVEQLYFLTHERKLSPETVVKFLPFISIVKDKKSEYSPLNIGFPYMKPGSDKITNFELRNFGFKGMVTGGDKQNSVWIAKFSEKPTAIYFAESAIDAMSYYELNQNKFNNFDSSVFISTGGYATDNQIKLSLNEFKDASVNTIFDNDLDGRLYDIRTAAAIANKEIKIIKQNENVSITANDKTFTVKKEDVSIERFKRETGIRAPLTVIKSGAFKDFNEALKYSKEKSLKMSK